MTISREEIIGLANESRASWDFLALRDRLNHAIARVQEDSTLLEVSKRPLMNLLNVAQKALEERFRSEPHLTEALKTAARSGSTLSVEEAKQLSAWFFHVVYAGRTMSLQLAEQIRPVLARSQGEPGANKKRLGQDIEMYARLARWGIDLQLSENNLCGLLAASLVLPLPKGFSEELRKRAEDVLASVRARKRLTADQLVQESLDNCRSVVTEAWKKNRNNPELFLSQEDSRALHICLHELLIGISNAEGLVESAQEMTDETNRLRAQFQDVRYRSSTNLLVRIKSEMDELSHGVDTSIDFEKLKARVSELGRRLNSSLHGIRGVSWMHEDHVAEAQAVLREVSERLKAREKDPMLFRSELASVEKRLDDAKAVTTYLSAAHLKGLRARVSRSAPLATWYRLCITDEKERSEVEARFDNIRKCLDDLWERMEGQQEVRAAAFVSECDALEQQIQVSIDPAGILSEMVETIRCREDFTRVTRATVQSRIDKLFETFKSRVVNVDLLRQCLDEMLSTITSYHRRIFSSIDFDELDRRITALKRWSSLRDFPVAHRTAVSKQISRCYAELRKLRFRQQQAKRDRQERAEMVAAGLLLEANDAQVKADSAPNKPETWQALVEVDKQYREAFPLLDETQRTNLRNLIDSSFNKVRAARAAFAAEAARVFADYNESLSNTLSALEDDGTREAAFEAIERVKPIRAQLRDERRLMRVQRLELDGLLRAISASIDEIFEHADEKAAEEWEGIRANCERLAAQIQRASTWREARDLITLHKELSAGVREAQISIAARKECRSELDRLWVEIEERLHDTEGSRDRSEDINLLLSRLERQGYLVTVDEVPRI